MPTYNPDHVEYDITNGNIQIAMENGTMLPAYWAHPNINAKFPGVALIHDWWGMTDFMRRIANLFAQVGHYVIVPDLFNGKIPKDHDEALTLLDNLGADGYKRVHTALSVLEHHHNCNSDVAAVGFGMGGSLAFEAAIIREDLEAAVAFSGFPQRYLGHFKRSNTPILAFYGTEEQLISPEVINRLRQELAVCTLPHRVEILEGAGHEIFGVGDSPDNDVYRHSAWHTTLNFLDGLLKGPNRPPTRKVY